MGCSVFFFSFFIDLMDSPCHMTGISDRNLKRLNCPMAQCLKLNSLTIIPRESN